MIETMGRTYKHAFGRILRLGVKRFVENAVAVATRCSFLAALIGRILRLGVKRLAGRHSLLVSRLSPLNRKGLLVDGQLKELEQLLAAAWINQVTQLG
jgi:hypothetical protein